MMYLAVVFHHFPPSSFHAADGDSMILKTLV